MLPYQNLSIQDMPGEIWKDIPNYEGCYQVSNMGRAKSLDRITGAKAGKVKRIKSHILKQSVIKGRKYLGINPSYNNVSTRIYLHRIVALLFVDNPEDKKCVDHINTITFDNRAENLRWVTYSENNLNEITKRRISKSKSGPNCFFYGKKFGARKVAAIFPDGSTSEFSSIKEASDKTGVIYKTILYNITHSITRKTPSCIKWKYVD